jgi:Divergent InlB B-repeat domain/Immune inhibitor A peptidase M6
MVSKKKTTAAALILFGIAAGLSSCTSSSTSRAQRPVDPTSRPAPKSGNEAKDVKEAAGAAAKVKSHATEPAPGGADDPRERERIWFNQRAYPANEIPSEVHRAAVLEELRRPRITALDGAANNWTNLAPGANKNITYGGSSNQDASGRTLAIAISPADQNLVLLGAAQGGIWKSTDRASTFHSVGDGLPSLAINVLRFAPSNSSVVYAGSGEPNSSTSIYGAGVFKSTDAGDTWQALPTSGADWSFDYLSVSGLQVDPRNANTLFVTTADILTVPNSFVPPPTTRHTGIFKSTDGGQTWSLLKAATAYTSPCTGTDVGFMDLKIGGPSQPDLLYATEFAGGIYKSTNAGQDWTRLTPLKAGGAGGYPAAVVSYGHPFYGGPFNVFPIRSDCPDFTRIDIAVPESNPNVIYAAYATLIILLDKDGNGTFDQTKDLAIPGGLLFKSVNGGSTWSWLGSWLRDGVPEYCASQCGYDNTIAVNPANENDVVIGGSANYNALWPDPIDNPTRTLYLPWRGMIYRTLDGGHTWVDTTPHCTEISSTPIQVPTGPTTTVSAFPCNPLKFDPTRVIHPDIHTAAYAPNGQIYIGNDGGIYRGTVTGAGTQSLDYKWENLNATLSTLQFFLFDSHPTDANKILGGLQDNSVAYFNGTFWDGWGFGDGTLGLFEPGPPGAPTGDPKHVYMGTQLNVHRHDDGGTKTSLDTSGNPAGGWHLSIFSKSSVAQGESVAFNPVFAIDPKQPVFVYGASDKALYDSGDRGDTWGPVKPFAATNGAPTVIEVSVVNDNYVWLGTRTGFVYLYDYTGGIHASAVNTGLPGRWVSKIVASATDANTAWVAYSGYNVNTPGTPGKVFKTTNKGQNWTNISGNLPDIPVSALAVDPANANRLWVGTDIGVFGTTDGGTTWNSERFNMPVVALTDLKYNATTGFLMGATHGRGLWRLAPNGAPAGPTLTVTKAGTGSGTVTSTPAGIACGGTCSASFPNGTPVSLSAVPDAGSTFAGWSGACTGTSACAVTMTSNQSVTATFNGTPAPGDFALVVPASMSATQGASGSGGVSTTVSGGFNAAVSLSASGLPSGATASFTPAAIAAPGAGSSTLTISTTASTPTGARTITITASGGGKTHTGTFSFTVNAAGGGSCTTGEALTDGGFESGLGPSGATGTSGTSGPWVWTSTGGYNPVTASNVNTPTKPHTGSWHAYFNNFGFTETDTIYQQVTIPAGATASLSFWLAVTTDEAYTQAFDTLDVQMLDSSGSLLNTLATYSNLNATSSTTSIGTYTKKTFDVSAFAGRTVRIKFTGTEDEAVPTGFFVDDVSLNITSCPPPPPPTNTCTGNQCLSLSKGRVGVTVTWQSQYTGQSGTAFDIPQKDEFGFFYFTDPNNPEVFVKVLDFGGPGALCFVGGLSDFGYTVTFKALATGQTLVFTKTPGLYTGFADNGTLHFSARPVLLGREGSSAPAFASASGLLNLGDSSGEGAVDAGAAGRAEAIAAAAAAAVVPQSLTLSLGRVQVIVEWSSQYDGSNGIAYAIPQQDGFGFFYFTNPNNPEVFVKVLDFGAGGALCFVGGLSDFHYKVTFKTLRTGQTLVFDKPAGQYIGFADNGTLRF